MAKHRLLFQCGPLGSRASAVIHPAALLIAGLLGLGVAPRLVAGDWAKAKAAELFQTTKIYQVHLKFTPEQWTAMEPEGGDRGMFGGGGPGGRGGRGGRGGPGGPGGFGPAMFVAPGFLKEGDQNADGKLSQDEFRALGEKWFTAWDKEKTGKLTEEQMKAGINVSLAPPDFGPPGGGGPGGGRPGGRGPGMNLQGAEGKRNGLASASGVEFKTVHAELEFEGQAFKDVAVRYKGNGTFMESRGTLKRSLKIALNHHVKGQKLAGQAKLNLHNSVTDASWMNEVLSYRLYRDGGVPASRTAYARVYVTVPGKYDREYLGLYSLVEDPDKNFAQDNFGTKEGAIFKPVTPNLFADLGNDWAKYQQTYDPKTDLTDAQKQRVIDFCRLVTAADDAEFAAKLPAFLDVDEFARYLAVTVWLSTMDSILALGQNYYVYLDPKTQKFQFLPWDLDHSFGQFPMVGSQEERENLSIHKPWRGENRFLERAFKVEAFKKVYLARLTEFTKTIFAPDRFQKQVDEVAAAIRPAVKEESADKLARLDKVAAGESVGRAGFGGGGPGGPGGFGQSAKPIKTFAKVRTQSVADQVAGKSEGQTLGEFGFGGGRGPGGRGGPGGFGPGMFLSGAFLGALDADKDGKVTHDEFTRGFAQWFAAWNTDKSGVLTEEQLRAGINQDLAPFRGGPPRE